MKTEHLGLIKGNAYMVKHENNKKEVRRIFKGTEERFDFIICFVFTVKVSKNVSVEIESTKNPDVNFWHWHNVRHPPNEISIPSYCLKSIKPINNEKNITA